MYDQEWRPPSLIDWLSFNVLCYLKRCNAQSRPQLIPSNRWFGSFRVLTLRPQKTRSTAISHVAGGVERSFIATEAQSRSRTPSLHLPRPSEWRTPVFSRAHRYLLQVHPHKVFVAQSTLMAADHSFCVVDLVIFWSSFLDWPHQWRVAITDSDVALIFGCEFPSGLRI